MLPPFKIRNLQPFSQPIRIHAPLYDETISSHPAAKLRYHDEDEGDLITLGSSKELAEKLEEPVLPPSSRLSADLEPGVQSSLHHVFEIDDRDYVRKLWQDIQTISSKHSEDVPVAQDEYGATKWSAEMKNKLAIFYESRKRQIWNSIAEELGVPWQSVDAMHWALGEEEIGRRVYELKNSGSSEKPRPEPEPSYDTPGMQQFEDFRVHYFNATTPPQVQLPMPETNQSSTATAGQVMLPNISSVDLDRSASSIIGKNGEANLTVEGKRQAQAAGDKLRALRARTTLSRHKKAAVTAVDSHQNRWANYKSSTSAFLPKASASVSQAFDGPGLTSEGKRQAQVAGDKLRCRTNPIRHSRPSRVGSLEHGISKNRWSSYSGTHATRFDQRQDPQDPEEEEEEEEEEAGNISNITSTREVPRDGQPSLLEVFEAELAKQVSATGPEVEPPTARTSLPEPAIRVDASSEISVPAQSQPLPQSSHSILGLINEHLQELTSGETASSPDFSRAIDHVRTTVGACIQGIARGLQEVSSVSLGAANRTRGADLQFMEDAIIGFQSLTGSFTAALGREVDANRPGATSVTRGRPGEVEIGSSSTTLGTFRDRDQDESAITAQESNESPLSSSVNPSEAAYSLSRPQLEMDRQPRSRPAMGQETRCHRLGPMHLPNPPGYVDRRRRSQSTTTFEEQFNVQRANSPPVETHFPTLAQFEGENFKATPSFPALPSMKPLIPQRALGQSVLSTTAREYEPADWSQSYASYPTSAEASQRSHDPGAGPRENCTERYENHCIPPSRLGSAARLAGPFDPLEAEPLARLRRNATIASTDIRHAARRRRPYSEVFDGSGRVAWDAFLQDNGRRPNGLSGARDQPLGADQEHLTKREEASQGSPLPAAAYDDQHHDDSTVGMINDCVEQLRDLGFGGDDDHSAGRLLVYAQAAEGVLEEAIDLIDEEQRAYTERL